MKGNRQSVIRLFMAAVAAALAIVLLASTTVSDRVDSTVLILLGAAAAILLVPWDKLASLKAVGVEITLNLPQVREAVESLGEAVDNAQVRRALERLGDDVAYVAGSRILWIDDNPLEILGVRRLLRALGADLVRITSTRDAAALLEEDNDFDLLISDLMRNDPEECITFGWMCELMGADREAEPEVIRRLDGTEVAFAVRKTRDGTLVHERREGVSFVVCLRAHSGWSPVVQKIPVLFYASFSAVEALSYARPAMLAGFDTDVTISAETLIPAAVRMIAASRSSPIRVGGAKAFVPGGQTRRPLSPDIREADAGASELVRTNPN